jgi:phosphoserine phosphatase RsbU/P
MYRTIERGCFVSMFYAVLDLDASTLTYARAGHNPALYFSRGQEQFVLLQPAGIALGLEKGDQFEHIIKEQQSPLQKGDLLVFYTDGFTEAMNAEKQEYSENQLLQSVQQNRNKSAQDIIEAVKEDIAAFVKDNPQHDDMTMVVIKMI